MSARGCCAHDHDCVEEECGGQWTLYQHIDTSHTCCLNESSPSSCLNVFRSWDARLDAIEVPLRSEDDDPELLLHIEFTGTVKLTGMTILNMGNQGSAPRRVRMFKNRNGLDFESVRDMKPDQEWDLFESHQAGTIEYPVKCVDESFTKIIMIC